MTNVNDLQSMERFIDKKIQPLNKQISMLQIELTGVKQQLIIPSVSQQRELLAFLMWYDEKMYHSSNKETALQVIDEYKANCA